MVAVLATALITGCGEREADESAESVEEEHHDLDVQADGPWAVNIEQLTLVNESYRSVIWTGNYLQLALMTLQPGENIDLELHNHHDQFIRIDQGEARVLMGKEKENMTFDQAVGDGWGLMIPAGYWHEVRNTGTTELKLYTIYGPAEHMPGTIHRTYAEAADDHHDH